MSNKSVNILAIICFLLVAYSPPFPCVNENDSINNNEKITKVQYKVLLTNIRSNDTLNAEGKLFIADTLVFEPIYQEELEHDVQMKKNEVSRVKSSSEARKSYSLIKYQITNLVEKRGIEFILDSSNSSRSYSLTAPFNSADGKRDGYSLNNEPILKNYLISDFKKDNDTIYQGAQHLTIACNKKVIDTSNGWAVIAKTKIIINQNDKKHYYSFISKLLAERFKGSIAQIKSIAEDGTQLLIMFNYADRITKEESHLITKFHKMYQAKLKLFTK